MIVTADTFPSAVSLMRTRPATAAGAEELYRDTDQFITQGSEMLQQDPARWTPVLDNMSTVVKDNFCNQLHQVDRVPALSETCREAALQALQMGLLAGAIDGTLLFVLHKDEALQAAPIVAPSSIETQALPDREELEKRLKEILAGAAAGLRDMGVWAVRQGSYMAKATGTEAVEQAGSIPDSGLPRAAYQAFLLTCFATGYAAAGLDSALIVGAGEQP